MFPDIFFTLSRLNWNSIIDILLVALIFYWMLVLVQGTKAVQLLRGIFFLVVVAVSATAIFDLTAFRWLINHSLPALLISIPVIFQPELRRALERLGRTGITLPGSTQAQQLKQTLEIVSSVAQILSNHKIGALIVLERETGLEDYIETGVRLDALISKELLLTIFHINTALHDGAVIIRHNRVVAASCVLPLSRLDTGEHIGTRHRAAIGLTETTDAIVVVVSEENGAISIAHNGKLIRHLGKIRLLKILNAFHRAQLTDNETTWSKLKQMLKGGRKQ
ncbi:MAG TPA: TIGR00159 family protein [Chloroflexi bacterium]|nr:TIGR00159 family protein [Chloroflexota bacterium]